MKWLKKIVNKFTRAKKETYSSNLKRDRGYGFCTCGLPLEKASKNSDDLCCYAQAFCKDNTGIIKKSNYDNKTRSRTIGS